MSVDTATQTAEKVLEVAAQIAHQEVELGQDPLSIGFDSISTVELSSRLEEQLGVECTIEDVFEAQTFEDLVRLLTARLESVGAR